MIKNIMKPMALAETGIDPMKLDKWKAILLETFKENCEREFVKPYGDPRFKVAEIDKRHELFERYGECTIIALFHKIETFDVPMEVVGAKT